LIYRAQEYIYDNLTVVKNVDEIAQSVGSSKSYLMHLFKKTTGISIIEFLTSQKILSAKQLLLFTQLPIREISDTLGYENPSQLSRVFKSTTGQTPSQFRKNQDL
jgi:AraC-type DNA-binding domain-containing proteins